MHHHQLPFRERLAGVSRASSDHAVPAGIDQTSSTRDDTKAPGETKAEPFSPANDAAAFQNLLSSLAETIEGLRTRRIRALDEVAHTSVELGILIAESLLGSAIATNRQRLDQNVRTCLERIATDRTVRLRAHPDDLALLQTQMHESQILKRYEGLLGFDADGSFARGRLKLEAEEIFVEWDPQRSLVELRNILLEEANIGS